MLVTTENNPFVIPIASTTSPSSHYFMDLEISGHADILDDMQRHSHALKSYLFIGLFFATAILLLYHFTASYHIQFPQNRDARLPLSNIRERPVVIYHPADFSPGVPSGFTVFHKMGCLIRNCVLTKADHYKRTADVIIFGENSEWEPPHKRLTNQIWIISLLESPENTKFLKKYRGKVRFYSRKVA
ncbi:unnamed protein product [Strongylus vulgaris]|uniref:Fucosyltransferase N-terminal domain-containing protein n=1 Tax=Strongylus vulgaris TaxID=40348 RepID=A0A3P7JLZ3_STRVU|nr:unnamed protein product [Strongylus vulgaris]